MTDDVVIAPSNSFLSRNEEMFFLEGPVGRLEAVITHPRIPSNFNAVSIVCHPHPLYDGSMNNKVTYTMARTMSELGVPAIRFNFRGVGQSDGRFADGTGETEDLLAVINYARQQYPGQQIWLAGFSFGSYVAMCATEYKDIDRLIMVAPCVNFFNFNKIAPPTCPWLVIQGQEDEIVAYKDVVAWLENVYPQPQFVSLPQVGHFFHKRLGDLRHAIEDFILGDERLKLKVAND